MNKSSDRNIWLFLILTFSLSWTIWFLSGVLPRTSTGAYDFRWWIAQIGVFAPSLTALLVSGRITKDLCRNSLKILPVLLIPLAVPGLPIAQEAPSQITAFGNLVVVSVVIVAAMVILFFLPWNHRLLSPGTGKVLEKPSRCWVLASATFFPLLFLVAWLLVNLPGGKGDISAYRHSALGFTGIVWLSFSHNILLGGPLGEEIGWRGFLLPELLKRTGPLAASLLLAVVWGLWHLPIDLYAGFLIQGPGAVLVRILWTLPVTVLFTWFYLRSQGSLLVALFLHASLGMLSDFGFSEYGRSLMVFFVLMTLAALIVSVSDPVFRKRTEPPIFMEGKEKSL